jgi:hypothetical protein
MAGWQSKHSTAAEESLAFWGVGVEGRVASTRLDSVGVGNSAVHLAGPLAVRQGSAAALEESRAEQSRAPQIRTTNGWLSGCEMCHFALRGDADPAMPWISQ